MSEILALWRLRQEDCFGLEISLDYTEALLQKSSEQTNKRQKILGLEPIFVMACICVLLDCNPH